MSRINRGFFYKVSQYSSLIWALGVFGTIVIIAIASSFATHDPDFSPNDPENIYLFPMLSFFLTGTIAFLVMCISWITYKITKGHQPISKLPMGITIGRMIFFVTFLLFGAFSFLFGMRQANVGQYAEEINATVTGQEIFDAVNKYRQSNGLALITLEDRLCDNLVQRYLDMTNPDNKYIGHAGFEKWAKEEGLDNDYQLAEVYVSGIRSGSEAINFWKGSPGHNSALIGDYKLGCAYANQGIAVAVFGNQND